MFKVQRLAVGIGLAVGIAFGVARAQEIRGSGEGENGPLPKVRKKSTTLRPLFNGDFERGLRRWRWNHKEDGWGLFDSVGLAEVAGDPREARNNILRLLNYAQAYTHHGLPAGVISQLDIRQTFLHEGSPLPVEGPEILTASAALGFEVVISPGARASFQITMHLNNLSRSKAVSIPMFAYSVEAPCEYPVAILGMIPWREYEIDLATIGAEIGDVLNVSFTTEIFGECDGPDQFVEVFTNTLIDDVAIEKRLPSPATPVGTLPAMISVYPIDWARESMSVGKLTSELLGEKARQLAADEEAPSLVGAPAFQRDRQCPVRVIDLLE